jgi:predicted nuclease with RNAse H fold
MRYGSIVGIDLSGPANAADTVAVVLEVHRPRAVYLKQVAGADDESILRLIMAEAARPKVVVGLDAPLSYEPGGGLRERDRDLRRLLVARGMRGGSIMPPTLNRMAYLTLRGMAVARFLTCPGWPNVRVVEVHPGAAFCLHGAPVESVREFKREPRHRRMLLTWLASQGFEGLPEQEPSDHLVAACGAALAAWRWSRGQEAWCAYPEPPLHPFAFAC